MLSNEHIPVKDRIIVHQDSNNSRAAVYSCSGNNTDNFLDLPIFVQVPDTGFGKGIRLCWPLIKIKNMFLNKYHVYEVKTESIDLHIL